MAVLIDLFSVLYGMFHVEHFFGNGFAMIDVPRGTYLESKQKRDPQVSIYTCI